MNINNSLPMPVDYVYQGFNLNPKAIAAIDDQESILYEELQARCEALALALIEKTEPGDRIALCAENHIDHLVCFIAILLAGRIWVPINPKNGAQLNQSLLKKSRPALALSDSYSEATIASYDGPRLYLRSELDDVNNIRQLIEKNRGKAFTPISQTLDDSFGIKFTGGTTGEPKGVVQSQRNVAAVVENMQHLFEFKQTDGNLAVAPLTHGGSHYILPLLAVGGRQILLRAPNPDSIADAFKNQGATVSFMPPTLIYKLIDNKSTHASDFDNLRHLTYSAAPMPQERIAQTIEFFGPKLSTVYGQTEAPMTITAMSAADMAKPELQSSVGKVCLYSHISILSETGEPLLTGETGEIACAGDIVMSGYFEEKNKTKEAFYGQWLLSGDLGFIDKNGYLFLQGRSKELIITGGFNVFPAEVENALAAIEGIDECAVFSMADDYWGERVEASIVVHDELTLDLAHVAATIKAQLGSVKAPKKYHVLKALPRNPVGKVVKRDIKALVENPDTYNTDK